MIDTIRFQLPLTSDQAELIKRKSIEVEKYDHANSTQVYQVFRTDLHLGSYDRNINIFFNEKYERLAKLELSIPKYFYGHNVYLFYLADFSGVIDELYHNLFAYFGDFPHPQTWKILRLDVCYAWKFQSQEIAQQILSSLKQFSIAGMHEHFYNTSYQLTSPSYSVKWYLKNPEFYQHDFKALLLSNKTEQAHQIESVSRGVLRFEVTIRARALRYFFEKKHIYISDISEAVCYTFLQKMFHKFFGGIVPQFMSHQDVLNTLLTLYSQEKARGLYMCYLAITSKNQNQIDAYKMLYPRSDTRSRHKKILRDSRIGISDADFPFSFDFGIPSGFAVNTTNPKPR